MGEYANFNGQRIKVGTCEDMYYLRWDQAYKVTESETDFNDPDILSVIRFRFPWPDEDGNAPGDFEPFRRMRLWGVPVPAEVEHGLVQFKAANGYLASLPCPESGELGASGMTRTVDGLTVHLNGYGGSCSLTAQGWRGGRLVGIAECNGCRHSYRLDDGNEEAVAVAIRSEADGKYRDADRNGTEGDRAIGDRLNLIADRLLAGYALTMSGGVNA